MKRNSALQLLVVMLIFGGGLLIPGIVREMIQGSSGQSVLACRGLFCRDRANPTIATGQSVDALSPAVLSAQIGGENDGDTTGSSQMVFGVPSAITSDIYFVYDGVTVAISDEVVAKFIRSDCPAEAHCMVRELPCVNVLRVRDYVDRTLRPLLTSGRTMKTAKNANGSFLYDTGDMGPDIDGLTGDISSVLTERIAVYTASVCGDTGGRGGESLEAPPVPSSIVRVRSVEVPGTDGTYSDTYIEIDHSQQQMYVWEDGRVTREYGVSGFFDKYHFFGVFSIINKSDNAWSSIAKKWMPFWMAYYYDPAQSAWLGIHELVYWTDENGVFHEEGSDSIGTKKSGGCVRLDRGEAEELYNWAEVGIPVLIHP